MTAAEITAALAEPFDPAEISWKPQSVKGNWALAIAYLNARAVMDRLDDTVGGSNWKDDYIVITGESVVCTLSVRFEGEWVPHQDVGSQSEQPDGGDRMKAAFSDALKRAAVKFGIGRYLYRLPPQWVDYDPTKRQFSADPQLPEWARPRPKAKRGRPTIGEELHKRLREKDAEFARAKLCQVGQLLSAVYDAGVKAGFGEDINLWTKESVAEVTKWVTDFEARAKESPNVKQWRETIAKEPDLPALNELVKGLEAFGDNDRMLSWTIAIDYAENAGWKWCDVNTSFVPA